MCIVSRRFSRIRWLLVGWLFASAVFAHPVAQGSATLTVADEQVLLELRVSLEQVLIASQANHSGSAVDNALLKQHGDYLLAHVSVLADGRPLGGQVVETPANAKGGLVYRLRYPLSNGPPGQLRLSQNLLREIDFAPGNPWEVSYRLVAYQGQRAIVEALFSHQSPLEIALNRNPAISRLGRDYVVQGWLHILHGYDHLLFVAGLVLAVGSLRELAVIVLLFTLAHGLTMTLAVLDWWRVSPRLVEPMIAFSIVAVSLQNVVWPRLSHGKPRQAIAFGFGLFHGLGFAGGLLDSIAALSAEQLAWAIAAFSLGVELGHLSVVMPLYYGLAVVGNRGAALPALSSLQRLGSLLVGIVGLLYCYYSISAALA